MIFFVFTQELEVKASQDPNNGVPEAEPQSETKEHTPKAEVPAGETSAGEGPAAELPATEKPPAQKL